MKIFWFIGLMLLVSCYHDLSHEKYIDNNSLDTLTVVNPDFDSVFTIYPGQSAMIYSFEILDTKQEMDDCRWLGDSLSIKNQNDSVCLKSPFIEENWSSKMEGTEKERLQVCKFSVDSGDF